MNIKQKNFKIFLFVDCSLMYYEGVYKFFLILILRSLLFFETENFARVQRPHSAQNCRLFGIEFLKIYLISRNV